MSLPPLVSVVCLSYNRPHLLRDALAALAAQTYPNLDVCVVDNRSPRSGEVAGVMAHFPQFRLIASGSNDGFTGGMNRGVREATGEFVCLTEDDLTLAPDYVERLVEHFAAHPDTGLAGGLLVNRWAGTVLCGGADYALAPVFRFQFRHEGAPVLAVPVSPAAVPFLSGSVLFFRRAVLATGGSLFRDDFFLYFEDLELSHRVGCRGLSVTLVPAARAYHAEVPAGPPSSVVEYHKYKNLFSVYLLHAPGRVIPRFALRYGPWAVFKSLAAGRFGEARLQVAAWANVVGRLGRLLSDRRRGG